MIEVNDDNNCINQPLIKYEPNTLLILNSTIILLFSSAPIFNHLFSQFRVDSAFVDITRSQALNV